MFDDDDNWSSHGQRSGNWGGHRQTPVGRVLVAAFGVLWTIFAIALTGAMPDFGPFAVAKYVFPAFGILFILGALFGGRSSKTKENVEGGKGEQRVVDDTEKRSEPVAQPRQMKLTCTRCGATPRNPVVSPHGDVKCEYCGTWYNVYHSGQ